MTSMSRTSSTSSFQGFSIYQPALGAPLQFLPAVGTKELEQLIDAYLPGPASAPEKRASISMDFFNHSGQTGEDFKYYAVYTPVTSPESAQSSSLNTSPVLSDMSFNSSPSQASTPGARGAAKKPRAASRKSAAKQEKTDFSDLPGMKILTKDGTDVTNSVSRGCKSKEQRDHAHLMRILKACDACKKKKIRCDPSHKKRAASQMESESRSEAAKPAKKTKKTTSATTAEQSASKAASAEESTSQLDDLGLNIDLSAPLDESWEQYLTFTDEPVAAAIPQDFYSAIPQDFDFYFGVENNNTFSPSASGSSVSPIQPVTPVSSGVVPHVDDFTTFGHEALAIFQSEHNSLEPDLPYLNPDGQHGSNYVDFNLFSPASSFVGEEPKLLKSGDKRNPSCASTLAAGNQNTPASSTGLLGDQEWRYDQSHLTVSPVEPEWYVPGVQVSNRPIATGDGELVNCGGSLPYHASDAGQDTSRSVHAVTSTQSLQSMRRYSPVDIVAQHGEGLFGGTGLNSVTAATSSEPLLSQTVITQASRQSIIPESTGNANISSQTVSPTKELRVLESGRRRPGRSTTRSALQLSATLTDAAAPSSSDSLSQLSLPLSHATGGLQDLNSPLEGATPSQTSQTLVAGNGLNRAAQSPQYAAEGLQHAAQGLRYAAGSNNVNATLPVHGPEPSQGLLCPAAKMPLRPLKTILAGGALLSTLPVRQLLASSSASFQLVACGLVSLLMVVVVMSILPMQTQTPILANLPITPVILLSLMSTMSAHQRLRASPYGGAISDGFRKNPSSAASTRRRNRSDWTGLVACVPMLSCA